jgi:hypothetical protein
VKVESLLDKLIKRLRKDGQTVRRYRDWFNVDLQYAKKATKKADVDFHQEFMKYEYHAQTIIRCRRDIARIENAYVEICGNERSRYRALLQDCRMEKRCDEIRRLAHSLVLHLDSIIGKTQEFRPHTIYSRLRALLIGLRNWWMQVEGVRRAEQKAEKILEDS